MSEKRMFSKNVVLSDAFLSMPPSTQALYYLFGMNCDDDGVVPNPKSLIKMGGYKKSDYQTLLDKRYILEDEKSKVAIIKHHKINNYIPKDRYKPSTYKEELDKLSLNEYGAYTEKENTKPIKSTKNDNSCIQGIGEPVYTDTYTQNSIDKSSIDKDKIDSSSSITNSINKQEESNFQQLDPVYKALENNFPMAPTTWVRAIEKYRSVISDELIINAIQEAAIAGVTNPKYFSSICERYKLNGYKKLSDIQNTDKNKKGKPKPLGKDEYNKLFVEQMTKKKVPELQDTS